MATNQPDGTKDKDPASADPSAVPAASSGGFKSWLPLIANLLLMPVLAYAMTTFVLLPKMKSGGSAASGAASGDHAGGASGGSDNHEVSRVNVPLSNKVLVNVSGTMGTRYLLANITLVGGQPELKESVEKKDAQLRDVAASVLASKTIADIDKPGARNLIRTELVSAFNNVLGNGVVSEIFFTEFAIQ